MTRYAKQRYAGRYSERESSCLRSARALVTKKEVNSSEDLLTAVNERLRRCWWCALVKACQRNSVYHRGGPPATRENACDECYRVGEQVRKAEVRKFAKQRYAPKFAFSVRTI